MRIEKLKDAHALEIEKALESNDGYCPCKPERAKDTKCMCREFKIDCFCNDGWYGTCHCGLYEKVKE